MNNASYVEKLELELKEMKEFVSKYLPDVLSKTIVGKTKIEDEMRPLAFNERNIKGKPSTSFCLC